MCVNVANPLRMTFQKVSGREGSMNTMFEKLLSKINDFLNNKMQEAIFLSREEKIRRKKPARAFFVLDSGEEGKWSSYSIPIINRNTLIGRDPAHVQVVLTDISVARIHAQLVETVSHEFLLNDEGSESGTFVNGDMISRNSVPISNGDILEFGRVKVVFSISQTQLEMDISSPP